MLAPVQVCQDLIPQSINYSCLYIIKAFMIQRHLFDAGNVIEYDSDDWRNCPCKKYTALYHKLGLCDNEKTCISIMMIMHYKIISIKNFDRILRIYLQFRNCSVY